MKNHDASYSKVKILVKTITAIVELDYSYSNKTSLNRNINKRRETILQRKNGSKY